MSSFTPIAVALIAIVACSEGNPLVEMCKNGDFSDTNPELEEVGGTRPQCVFKDRGDGRWFASVENATIIPQGLLTYVAASNEVFQLQFTELSPGVHAYVMVSSFVPDLVGGIAILAASDSRTPENLPTFIPILICKGNQPEATFVKFFGVPSPDEVRMLQEVYGVPATEDLIKPCVAASMPY